MIKYRQNVQKYVLKVVVPKTVLVVPQTAKSADLYIIL
jgi:hypothetical protein